MPFHTTIKEFLSSESRPKHLISLYVSGGWVRNKLFGCVGFDDIDLVVCGTTPSQLLTEFIPWLAKNDKTVKLRVLKLNPEKYRTTEVVKIQVRPEKISLDITHIVDKDCLYADARRRDLTMNALYLDIETEEIIDPLGRGITDIKGKMMVSCDHPVITLSNDPIRVLRIARFLAIYTEFRLDKELFKACNDSHIAYLLAEEMPEDRLRKEFFKLIDLPECGVRGLRFLNELDSSVMRSLDRLFTYTQKNWCRQKKIEVEVYMSDEFSPLRYDDYEYFLEPDKEMSFPDINKPGLNESGFEYELWEGSEDVDSHAETLRNSGINSKQSIRENLFDFAIQHHLCQKKNVAGDAIENCYPLNLSSSGLSFLDMVKEIALTSVVKDHTQVITKWAGIVLGVAEALGTSVKSDGIGVDELKELEEFVEIMRTTIKDWIQEHLGKKDVEAILTFLGLKLKGRYKTTKKPHLEMLEMVTLSLAKYYRTPAQTPGNIAAFFYNSRARLNPLRGTTDEDKNVKLIRNCRFCNYPIRQVHKRKKKINATATTQEESEMLTLDSDLQKTNMAFPDIYSVQFHRKKTMCDDGCVFFYLVGSRAKEARSGTAVRDGGVCASCGADCARLLKLYRNELRTSLGGQISGEKLVYVDNHLVEQVQETICRIFPSGWPNHTLLKRAMNRIKSAKREVRAKYPKMGLREGDLWQADHIIPVVLGGGEAYSPIALRTLCVVCHLRVTIKLRAALSKTK